MTKSISVLLATTAFIGLVESRTAHADVWFDTPQPRSCVRDGVRMWAAIITGRGYNGDWVAACRTTTARINGRDYASHDCGWNGGRVWGQFDVVDASCATTGPHWEPPKRDQCTSNGVRQWSAIITGPPSTPDWVRACAATPITIQGHALRAHDCGWNGGRVWGRFDVPDQSCATPPPSPPPPVRIEWLPPRQDSCVRRGVRQWSAIITGTGYTGDWLEACRRTRITIAGASYAARACSWNGGRVWGEFDVADESCMPKYKDFTSRCTAEGIRTHSARLEDVPAGMDWDVACNTTPENIDGHAFAHASRCRHEALREVGEFDVPDDRCRSNRPVATCRAPGAPSGASDELALFVVGPNHTDVRPYGNTDAASVENLAIRIHDAWKGDPRKLVVAISETGGCSNCGSPTTAIASGSAHVLAGKLNQLYGVSFEVRRAIPNLPTDYASMPAIITGGYWAPAPGSPNFIGKDYRSRSALRSEGGTNRYGRIQLESRSRTIGVSIVHLAPGEDATQSANRLVQMTDLLAEANDTAGSVAANFIVGDFNRTLVGDGADANDRQWITNLGASHLKWKSHQVPCTLPDNTTATFYKDIMNIIELASGDALTPLRYFHDVPRDGSAPGGEMRVVGVAHPMLGVVFGASSASTSPEEAACLAQCGQSNTRCLAGCESRPGGCSNRCTDVLRACLAACRRR